VYSLSIISELIKEAEASPHHEAFKTIHSTKKTRIGAGLKTTDTQEFFIEVNIKTCTSDPVDPRKLVELGITLEALENAGFSLSCEDNGFYAMKKVSRERLIIEIEATSSLFSL
jgi:hypothetical protein